MKKKKLSCLLICFLLIANTLTFSQGTNATTNYYLIPDSGLFLNDIVVKNTKRNKPKYSRKNNPAVDLMKEVIAQKKKNDARRQPNYAPFKVYKKINTALDNVREEKLKAMFRVFPEMKNQKERSPISEEYILPLNIDENVYRANAFVKRAKTQEWLEGAKSVGFTNLLTVEDAVNKAMQSTFRDLDIYQNQMSLMNRSYTSPIADNATLFYKYYLVDTVKVDSIDCIHLFFTPMNSLDYGFNGDIYIVKDSTYAVRQLKLRLPRHHALNFAQGLWITQNYVQMPNGGWAMKNEDFSIKIYFFKNMQGLFIHKNTAYFNASDTISDSLSVVNPEERVTKRAMAAIKSRDELFWDINRQKPLSDKEKKVLSMFDTIMQKPGVKPVIYISKSLAENYFETSPLGKPSYFDIGQIHSIFSGNSIEGFRMRLGGQTTSHLSPYIFAKGWLAYGFGDNRFKGMANLAYSLKPVMYGVNDFPKHYISATYRYDLESPTDPFLQYDKDHFIYLLNFRSNMMRTYNRTIAFDYEYETPFYLTISANASYKTMESAGAMTFKPNLEGSDFVKEINASTVTLRVRFAPGEEFAVGKDGRVSLNDNAPVFTLSHTMGINGFMGSDYTSNLTEIGAFKRLRLSSWGYFDAYAKAGTQWNQVPYPLLIVPKANTSIVMQKDAFSLLNTMEFLNDRFLSADLTYHLEGKLFNRIPGIKYLKVKEVFGFKALWGGLSALNNPNIMQSKNLFELPSPSTQQAVSVMNPNVPYMELSVGLYNILKFARIDYVHRLNYKDLPGAQRWGIRVGIDW
ncbi:MAG: DUF5686 family protein [Bacteroidales bacterium]